MIKIALNIISARIYKICVCQCANKLRNKSNMKTDLVKNYENEIQILGFN